MADLGQKEIAMLHRLTEWEDNGPNDSDFWVSVFDDETGQVRAIMSGSTRFAGFATMPDLGQRISDPAILHRAIDALANHIYGVIRAAEYRNVLEPEVVQIGTTVRLLKDKKEKGIVVAPAGTFGDVFWSKAFGQFYKNGYNRPNRANTRLGIRLENGDKFFVGLSSCRLHREPDTDEQLRERAIELSHGCQFSQMTGKKHAWDSDNYALALLKKIKSAAVGTEEVPAAA